MKKVLELGCNKERTGNSINNRLYGWFKEVKDYFWQDTRGAAKNMIKLLLEECLQIELSDHIGFAYYEHSPLRADKRNGYYMRGLSTDMGYLEQIRVPRPRGRGFSFLAIKRYQRRQDTVNKLLLDTFLAGVSTRRVGEVLEHVIEDKPSSSTISRVTKVLDKEVNEFHNKQLTDEYIYLILDGVYMGIKGSIHSKKRPVLVAYGIKANGERAIIDYQQASSESEAQWTAFLNNLYKRGLAGKNLRLITVDGGKGLHRALETVYPFIPIQLCWVHKLRNVSKRIPKKHRILAMKEVKKIYLADTKKQAVQVFKDWKKSWNKHIPEAVKCLETDMDMLLPFFNCPKNHRIKIRTTNAIERCFREVRRRTRPMSCFTNYASCDRIIFAVFNYQNLKWKDKPIKNFIKKDTI